MEVIKVGEKFEIHATKQELDRILGTLAVCSALISRVCPNDEFGIAAIGRELQFKCYPEDAAGFDQAIEFAAKEFKR